MDIFRVLDTFCLSKCIIFFPPVPVHQSLESVLRHPADNRTQIRELGQTLIDGGILDDIISEKLEAFNSRYEELSHLVRIGTGMSVRWVFVIGN